MLNNRSGWEIYFNPSETIFAFIRFKWTHFQSEWEGYFNQSGKYI